MIGFIGTGNMAGAIIQGIVSGGFCPMDQIGVFDVDPEKTARFPGAKTYASIRELIEGEPICFFSVKPQVLPKVLGEVFGMDVSQKLFVSICAGISASFISERLVGARVVRAMPNTPMLYGKGICALSQGESVTDSEFEKIKEMFSLLGQVIVLPETMMNAVIALTSSSPAYLFALADVMAKASVEEGFSYEDSVKLCAGVFEGAAVMLRESGMSPEELCAMVASPGGTTLAALNVLNQKDFSGTVTEAMRACTRRAKELSQ